MRIVLFLVVVLLILVFRKKNQSGSKDVAYKTDESLKQANAENPDQTSEDSELLADCESVENESLKQTNVEDSDPSIETLTLLTGCECIKIVGKKSGLSSQEILKKYYFYLEQGKREGFTPVFINDNEDVIEIMKFNAKASSAKTEEELRTTMENYRNKLLSSDVADGRAYLEDQLENDIKKYPHKWNSFMNGQAAERNEEDDEKEVYDCLSLNNSFDNIVMVKVPVTEPWKIWAYIPYGNWNACPTPEEHMAVSKYWYETYGAIPVAISFACVDYLLPRPVDDPKKTAIEMYAYCGDLEQGYDNFASIGESIKDRRTWNFWWD